MSKSRKLWDMAGWAYRRAITHSRAHKKQFEDVYNALKLQQGQTILDAGCATGTFEQFLIERDSLNVEINALDFSNKMLSRARQNCPNPRIHFFQGSLNQGLPFKEETFDAIVCVNVFFAVPRPDFTLQEFYRVLKPNAKLILVDPIPTTGTLKDKLKMITGFGEELKGLTRKEKFYSSLSMLWMLILNMRMHRWVKQGRYRLFSKEEHLKNLKSIGFRSIAISKTLADKNWLILAQKEGKNE